MAADEAGAASTSPRVHEVGIRDAGPNDLRLLASMHLAACDALAALPKGVPLVDELRRGGDPDSVGASFEEALASPGSEVLMGLLGTAEVGYGVLLADRARGRISELWVEPGARGVGIGTALLAALRARASARSLSGIDSVALPGDRDTKNFFEEHAMVARAIVVGTSDL
jgi:GNAT superfamily N-acetyltransferase